MRPFGFIAFVSATYALSLVSRAAAQGTVSLTGVAHKIDSVPAVLQARYLWQSDRSLLCLSWDEQSQRFVLDRIDTDTGARLSLASKFQRYQSSLSGTSVISQTQLPTGQLRSALIHVPPQISLSPDRSWLLMQSSDLSFYTAVRINENSEVRYRANGPGSAYWTHVGHEWLETSQTRQSSTANLVLHDVDRPKFARQILNRRVGVKRPVIGISAEGCLVSSDTAGNGPVKSARLSLVGIFLGSPAIRSLTVMFPVACEVDTVEISVTGDRLAWVLDYYDVAALSKVLHRVVPATPMRGKRMTGIWVSRCDGSQMREIGSVLSMPNPLNDGIGNLAWEPAGTELSFTYNGAFYTVGVPR